MPESASRIPSPFDYDDTWMLYVLLGIVAMFLAAYWIEKWRRHSEWKRTLEAEYAALSDLGRDKDLTAAEQEILEDLARRFAAQEPFRVGTMREVFNRCVDAVMDEALKQGDAALLRKRGEVLRDIRVKLGLDYVPFGLRIRSTRELCAQQPTWCSVKQDLEPALWTRMVVVMVDEAHFYLRHDDTVPMPAVHIGDTIHFRLWREEDARYEFNARLVERKGEAPEWTLQHTSRLRRLQARAHFRIKFDYACEIGVVNAPVDGDMTGVAERPVVTRLRGRVTSLSGGGYAVVVTQPVPRQVLLRVAFDFGGEHAPVLTNAKVVGSLDVPGGRHLLRASFVGISEEDREVITRFIFLTQQAATTTGGAGTPAASARYEG